MFLPELSVCFLFQTKILSSLGCGHSDYSPLHRKIMTISKLDLPTIHNEVYFYCTWKYSGSFNCWISGNWPAVTRSSSKYLFVYSVLFVLCSSLIAHGKKKWWDIVQFLCCFCQLQPIIMMQKGLILVFELEFDLISFLVWNLCLSYEKKFSLWICRILCFSQIVGIYFFFNCWLIDYQLDFLENSCELWPLKCQIELSVCTTWSLLDPQG